MSVHEPAPTAASGVRLVSAPARPADLLLRDVHALDPRTGLNARSDVLVRGGEIAEIAAAATLAKPDGCEVVEGEGRHLFPAFVDPHVHLRTPGQEHKEDLETGTRSAAAGGYCAVIAMPNTSPTIDSAPILGALLDAAAREARVPVGFMPAITRGLQGRELTDMAELRALGAAGFTDDGRPVTDAGVFRRALQYQRLCGGVLALHEEDPALSGKGAMHEGTVSAQLGVAGIPSVSESTMIARDCALAGFEGARIHIQHLSARESVEVIRDAKARGVAVTCEASPHHLTMTDEDVLTLDTRRKMNPPLRAEEDRQALIAGLVDGTIDCIATDHAPHARDEKDVPFEQAPMGTTGLETAFAAVYTDLVLPGTLSLELVVCKLTAGLGLLDLFVPTIAAGEPANLVLVDLDAEWVVGDSGYESRSQNCCFAGRMLRGRVQLTIAAGAVAYRERSTLLSVPACSSTAYVLLEDGTRFDGIAVGAPHAATGEVVFTTGMSGYQESVTDPSFANQIITFTYPHIGNYGVSAEAMESERVWARAVIMRAAMNTEDAPGAERGWLDWLCDCGVPAISEVDTRALVRHIRDAGSMRGGVFPQSIEQDEALHRVRAETPMEGLDLASVVTPREMTVHGSGDGPRIAAIDTGIKLSIVRQLVARGAVVELHPCDVTADELLAREADLVFLANGPGDPAALEHIVQTVRGVVGKRPVWGICLGHQLLCQAVGLETYKLRFGHRGANHPVKDLTTQKIEITSQNHGFAVRPPGGATRMDTTEPVRWETDFGAAELTHVNLYDGTVEGLTLLDVPASTVQYHPEAGPGPNDSLYLFDRFLSAAKAGV